jgi:hypothetical protein
VEPKFKELTVQAQVEAITNLTMNQGKPQCI